MPVGDASREVCRGFPPTALEVARTLSMADDSIACHAVLEHRWPSTHGPLRDRHRRLLQGGVVLDHARRGHLVGACQVLTRRHLSVERYPTDRLGSDGAAFGAGARQSLVWFEDGAHAREASPLLWRPCARPEGANPSDEGSLGRWWFLHGRSEFSS